MTAVRDGFGVRLAAFVQALFAFGMGVFYLPGTPETLVRRPLPPGQVSAVVFIESIGPIWTLLFAVAAIGLFFAALRGVRFVVAYLVAAFAWALYGGSIMWSAYFTVPPAPVVAGYMSLGIALTSIACARAAAERGSN